MINLLKAELYKLRTSKNFYLVILLNILQCIVVYAFSEKFRYLNGKEMFSRMFDMQNYLGFWELIAIFASDYIVTEFSSGYIKNLVSYGHKRVSIFISKGIAYFIGIAIICCVLPIVMSIINTVVNGYGEAFDFQSVMYFIGLILLMIFIHCSIASIGLLAAFISKNASVTVAAIVMIDVANRIINIFAIRSHTADVLYNKLIFAQITKVLSDNVKVFDIFQAVIISLVTMFVCMIIGLFVFKRAEIK